VEDEEEEEEEEEEEDELWDAVEDEDVEEEDEEEEEEEEDEEFLLRRTKTHTERNEISEKVRTGKSKETWKSCFSGREEERANRCCRFRSKGRSHRHPG
jgi:hypothetical protein